MARLAFTKKAVDDLGNIWSYTCEVWSENQADKYYQLLIDTCAKIAKETYYGKKFNDIENNLLGFKVGKHIIFYQRIKHMEILVVRILHQQMDLKNRVDEESPL